MLLKVGSKGQDVKDLQEFLGVTADGIFGKGTEGKVKLWQADNGLVADGIVGRNTWEVMGMVTTDATEKSYTVENGLVINRHFLPSDEYRQGPIKPEWIFLHHTAGWNNPYKTVDNWGNDTRGRISTEFVLGGPSVKGNNEKYDGVIVQAFPEGNWGYHLGRNGSQTMHKNSIGMEVCNFGYVVNGKTYAGTVVEESQIVTLTKPFKGHSTWHRYSDKQISNLKLWLEFIGKRDGIDITAGLPALVKQYGADAFEFNEDVYYGRVKGVWTHTNTRKDKFDMFPQQELLDMLVSL
tara:strand:+ start:50 stop:931 length:882 start_codon:yes stop_codon:yes gene_type:complete